MITDHDSDSSACIHYGDNSKSNILYSLAGKYD